MNTATTETGKRCTFGVTIFECVPSWRGGSHDVHVLGFGAIGATELGQAEEQAEKQARYLAERVGRDHRFEVQAFCATCKASGIKPGCKRKDCEACGGRGAIGLLGGQVRAAT